MNHSQKVSLTLLRLALGVLYFYAGVSKLFNPSWSAAGYLKTATTFAPLYSWLASGSILPFINFINAWGLTLLGVALILGIFVRISGILGAILMVLYYFVILHFPFVGTNYFLVDEHVIFALVLIYLGIAQAGHVWGLDEWCSKRFPKLKKLFN